MTVVEHNQSQRNAAERRGSTRRSGLTIAFGVVGAVVGALLVSRGLATDDAGWWLVGVVLFAPLVVAASHWVSARVESAPKAAALAAVAMLLLAGTVTVIVSYDWWDDSHDPAHLAYRLASNVPGSYVYVHATPGSPE